MVIFFNFSLASSQLYPLQVENCDSNSQLVVDEDDNGKFRRERVKCWTIISDNFTTLKQHCLDVNLMIVHQAFDCS